ncbi:DUF2867 domain-containing protein [Hymenobacter metallicola]|uniref:DUF2867 domain-containing protein n=1 Tax=Hymenobacter metallicola TaxID=2563114 RepID=A0A4Z0QFH9_9BACT|nr:DUF2867 domain-containing protein [Hymenobacter metallicola]TGE27953.1 DUF2867 domain-containing protein [Hymenobacter metallicola]
MPRLSVSAVALPSSSSLQAAAAPDHTDAYRLALPAGAAADATALTWRLFGQTPAWIRYLMRLRDWLVRPLRLTTFPETIRPPYGTALVPGSSLGAFRVFATAPHEVVLGLDDRHLDFRVSVLLAEDGRAAVVSTLVWFHNWVGRWYFQLIQPFHHLVVPALLRHALRQEPNHPPVGHPGR